jgi:hypothetical protein
MEGRSANECVEGVDLRRTFVLTREYFLDVFSLASEKEHTYDYLYHNFGRLSVELDMRDHAGGIGPPAGWRGRRNGYEYLKSQKTARADGMIRALFEPPGLRVRFLMGAAPGTTVVQSTGPAYLYSPKVANHMKRAPVILCRREAARTRFVAVVEATPGSPRVESVRSGADEASHLAVEVRGKEGMLDTYLRSFSDEPAFAGGVELRGALGAVRRSRSATSTLSLVKGTSLRLAGASLRLRPSGTVTAFATSREGTGAPGRGEWTIASASDEALEVRLAGVVPHHPEITWERGGSGRIRFAFRRGTLSLSLPPRAVVRVDSQAR